MALPKRRQSKARGRKDELTTRQIRLAPVPAPAMWASKNATEFAQLWIL